MNNKNINKAISTVITAVLILVPAVIGIIISKNHLPDTLDKNAMRAVFFDVGQGDCMLYHGECGTILIDAPYDKTEPLLGYLKRWGIKNIDYFIVTHYDADHAGDAAKIAGEITVGALIMPEPFSDNAAIYESIIKAAGAVTVHKAKNGDKYDMNGVTVEILAPNRIGGSSNERCVVSRISYGGRSLLSCSDIDTAEERIMLSRYGSKLASDVVKVAHHGSKYSSSENFVAAVSASYAVISCGENSYGHPDVEVMERFEKYGAEVLVTQADGVVIFDFLPGLVVRKK